VVVIPALLPQVAALLAAGLVTALALPLRPSVPRAAAQLASSDVPRAGLRHLDRVGVAAAVVAVAAAFGPVAAFGALAVGAAAPSLRERQERRRRVRAIETDVPEVVDLLALAVGSGLTVPHAVRAVARRVPGPLAAELATVVAATDRGHRFADALDDLPERAGEATRPLVATLGACERYGAPVADALERLAVEARERHRRRAEQAARRLPVLLLFPLVVCILPAFALLAVAPLIADAVQALRP
jgi:tight adherence protein C